MEPRIEQGGGVRRHVAVLFADISGFTHLVDTLEPENVFALVRPLMDELVLLVHLHDGEIQQVLGDGFMAVFGLRDTHGDEAARAVRAGLALVSAGHAAARPRLHAGVEYGEVLVTPSWHPATFGVWGRPVNLAKRLCEVAGPGEVQIGPAAFAGSGGGAVSAEPARIRVRGFAEAVDVYRITSGEALMLTG
jgi:class 3 adenylate cyclase